MKMDLIRKQDGRHWECTRSPWESLIELAEKSGYKAQGTTQYDFDTGEPDDDWDGTDYISKSGQLVSGKDDQLNEGYSFLSNSQQKKYRDFVQGMVDDAEAWGNVRKSTRKPRTRKIRSVEQRWLR